MNEEMYYFSAKTNSFYLLSLKVSYEESGTWPEDGIAVSNDVFAEFTANPPEGKVRGQKKGMPAWVAAPDKTKEQYVAEATQMKTSLAQLAANKKSPLQDAVDLDMATEQEKALLVAWKTYSVLINRVDVSTAPDITWPEEPSDVSGA